MIVLAVSAVLLSMISAGTDWVPYSTHNCLICYELPASWQVQTQGNLEAAGVISPPYPIYMLIAGDGPASLSDAVFTKTYGKACPTDGRSCPYPPSDYALHPAGEPWFEVIVTTAPAGSVPTAAQAYAAFPSYVEDLWEMQGAPRAKDVTLTKPVEVGYGGAAGTRARVEIEVQGLPSTEVNSEAFVKGNEMWMVIDGCNVTCYNNNAGELDDIIGSVRVATSLAT
jgi:hypothetical protein